MRIPRSTAALLFASSLAVAASDARLSGRVQDDTGGALAEVTIDVDGQRVQTDTQGRFEMPALTPGLHHLRVRAPGRALLERELNLSSGENPLGTLRLARELATVTVTGSTAGAKQQFAERADSDTLTESVSKDALKNPNAQSGGDLIKEVSGVAVSKGANGSSTVSVRGIDQRMLRFTVDGQRQGGTANPLDSLPPEIVQSLEVTKTFTPDMESDAVGGVISINTGGNVIKSPYEQGRHQLVYNTLAPHPGSRNSLSLGEPFALGGGTKNNASALATLSFDDLYSHRERLSDLREWTAQISPGPAPYTGTAVPTLTLPLIESSQDHRNRGGLLLNGDARFGTLSAYWRSSLNRDRVGRVRDIDDTNPASGSVVALTPTSGTFSGVSLSRRQQDQVTQRDVMNLSGGLIQRLAHAEYSGSLSYALTHEAEPDTLETGFVSDSTYTASYDLAPDPYGPQYRYVKESDPSDTASASDPTHYLFNYLNRTHGSVLDEDGNAKFDLKFDADDHGSYYKFGGKFAQRRRSANIDRTVYNAGSTPVTMSALVGEPEVTLDTASYVYGPVPNANLVQNAIDNNPSAFTINATQSAINSGGGDYVVNQQLWSLYGMQKFKYERWTLISGLRVEGTHMRSAGNQMQLDSSGAFQGFLPVAAGRDYAEFLPGAHLRYDAAPGLLYRASITRSQSRPDAADLAPFRTLSFIDHRSRVGSPELKPYLATNYDASVDRYDERYGLVSFGLFYKKIDHFITDAQYPVVIGDLGTFIEFKRINGETAQAMGGELAWQSTGWTLPVLGKLSMEANYSYNHGRAHYPQRPGETFPMPRQVVNQGGIKLHEVAGALSLDAGLSYRSGWWEDLIAPGFDNYINSAWDAEISGAWKLGKNTRITGGFSNLLNQATRHYAGIPSRMNDWQRNGVDMTLGLQWKLGG